MDGSYLPPPRERAVGLGFYLSRSPGAAGRIKSDPEAFKVDEISAYPLPRADGPFVVVRIRSRNWEQHELGRAIARRLRLAPDAVRWSGTKDRRAIAERLFSYRGEPPPPEFALPETEILEVYRAGTGLALGHHYGNRFELTVTELADGSSAALAAYARVRDELARAGAFPNLFGLQRFGEVRPVTHDVGRAIVRGSLEEAVEIYLTARPGESDEPHASARAAYALDHDVARALREFPPEYRFERAMLRELERGRGAEGALRSLARELRLLFVHAYQSLLFNRWLTLRHAAGIPLDEPAEGDRLLRLATDGTVRADAAVPVAADNLAECVALVKRGRARVAGPLIGYRTTPIPGRIGELLEAVLAEEELTPERFRLPRVPDLASAGAWRPTTVPWPPLELAADGDRAVRFGFALPKGAYATVLMREFLKDGATGSGSDGSKRG